MITGNALITDSARQKEACRQVIRGKRGLGPSRRGHHALRAAIEDHLGAKEGDPGGDEPHRRGARRGDQRGRHQ